MGYKHLVALVSVVLVIGLTGFSLQAAKEGADADGSRDGVLVHLTAGPEDPHRVLMALQMASKMSESRPVAMYLDIEAVRIVLADSPDLTFAEFPSSHTQLKELIGRGVHVMACPGCLAVAGKKESDLMKGVHVASKDEFFTFTDGRILTLDY